jgi:Transglycosylase SLT domain
VKSKTRKLAGRRTKRWGLKKRFFIPVIFTALILLGFSDPTSPTGVQAPNWVQPPESLPDSNRSNPGLSDTPWDYFQPSWLKSNSWTIVPISTDSENSIDFSKSALLIADPQNRIEKEFLPSPELRGRVQFWIDIYSRFSSHTRVIHDKRNPEVIFGYIDFRPLYRNLPSKKIADGKAASFEKRILKELRVRLDEAAGVSPTHHLNVEEKAALQSFLSRSGALDKASYGRLIKSIRTQTGQRDVFLMALQRSKYLLPHIESVFKQQGLPVALARIPFVESSFNAKALSKIGAVGIWQFTPETAKELIHADSESLWADPLRQTKSAAKLLKLYRSALPDWGTTITSYNSGVGRVRRIVEKYKISSVGGLVELCHEDTLGFAGKNFYSEFLAANLVEAYKEELFGSLLNGVNSMLVFKNNGAIPKEFCDL